MSHPVCCHFSFASEQTRKLKVIEEMAECVFNRQVPIEILCHTCVHTHTYAYTHTHTHTASKCVVCFNPQEVLHQGGQHGAAVPVLHWSSTFFSNLTPYDSIPLSNEEDNFIADLYSQCDCSGCCAV